MGPGVGRVVGVGVKVMVGRGVLVPVGDGAMVEVEVGIAAGVIRGSVSDTRSQDRAGAINDPRNKMTIRERFIIFVHSPGAPAQCTCSYTIFKQRDQPNMAIPNQAKPALSSVTPIERTKA
jgi:hypothetical protein